MHTSTTSNELYSFKKNEQSKKSSSKRKWKWKCSLSTMNIDEYIIIPLTSSKMLKSEGYHMNNCCKDYTKQCVDQKYCIFSIRDSFGNRLATLGAVNSDNYWRFDQCTGHSNTNVTDHFTEHMDPSGQIHTDLSHSEIFYVANEVVRLLNVTSSH